MGAWSGNILMNPNLQIQSQGLHECTPDRNQGKCRIRAYDNADTPTHAYDNDHNKGAIFAFVTWSSLSRNLSWSPAHALHASEYQRNLGHGVAAHALVWLVGVKIETSGMG